jgi:hypothetical protein
LALGEDGGFPPDFRRLSLLAERLQGTGVQPSGEIDEIAGPGSCRTISVARLNCASASAN